jgi:hypothetical protein
MGTIIVVASALQSNQFRPIALAPLFEPIGVDEPWSEVVGPFLDHQAESFILEHADLSPNP